MKNESVDVSQWPNLSKFHRYINPRSIRHVQDCLFLIGNLRKNVFTITDNCIVHSKLKTHYSFSTQTHVINKHEALWLFSHMYMNEYNINKYGCIDIKTIF